MPMVDDLKATLKADLDVTELNQHLGLFVKQEVEKGVQTALSSLVRGMVEEKNKEAELYINSKLEEADRKYGEEISKRFTLFQLETQSRDLQQYAFFATMSTIKTDMSANEIIVFDEVALNLGGAYNGNTGIFTCKEPGVYTFSWTIVSEAQKDFTSLLYVRDKYVAANFVDNDSTKDMMTGSTTVIVQMGKGDTAVLKVYSSYGLHLSGTIGSLKRISMFSGFKIN